MGKMWRLGSIPSPKRSDRYPDGHPVAVEGMRLVLATLRIIAMLQPAYWAIENPRARLRSLDLLAGIPRRTVWYWRLGLDRAKPTDLWGVFPPGLELPPGCHNGNPDHVAAPRGSRTGTPGGVSTEEAGRIPHALADAFRGALEREAARAFRSQGHPPPSWITRRWRARARGAGRTALGDGACAHDRPRSLARIGAFRTRKADSRRRAGVSRTRCRGRRLRGRWMAPRATEALTRREGRPPSYSVAGTPSNVMDRTSASIDVNGGAKSSGAASFSA